MNKVIHGDCLEIMKDMPSELFDLILCDLPYGITASKADKSLDLEQLWACYNSILKDNAPIILTAVQPFTTKLINSATIPFRYSLVWKKTTPTGFLNANRMPLRVHEDILVFYRKLPTYRPQKTKGHTRKISSKEHRRNSVATEIYKDHDLVSYDSTERYPTSVLEFPTDKQRNHFHPNQKPLALFEYLIKTYTLEGDLVLDNCIGSGTTAVACINLNRNFIGIELDPEYFEIAKNRIKDAQINQEVNHAESLVHKTRDTDTPEHTEASPRTESEDD